MKKKYEKPLIAVENFVLSQTIADCGVKISYTDWKCVATDSDTPDGFRNLAISMKLFSETPGCDMVTTDKDDFNGICYHTSTALMFTS